MHYNEKIHIERVNGKFNSTVELSGPGRSGVRRASTATFEDCMKAVAEHHAELLGNVEAYVNPPELAAQREADAQAQAQADSKAQAAAKKAAAKAKKKEKAAAKEGNGKTEKPNKAKARQFAAD